MTPDLERAQGGDEQIRTQAQAHAVTQDVATKAEHSLQSPATAEAVHELDYPDGGLTAWAQVLAGHLVNSMAWGYASTYGVYQLYYTETLHLPKAQISWIGSLQVFLTFVMCTISGRLSDAGYGRHAVLSGSLLAVFGTFMTSLATRYWEIFLAQGVCTGLGLGLMFMPSVAVISSYFKRKRSLALAVSATGTGTGSTVFPATVQYLIPKVGFPWAVRCAAFIALFFVVLMILLLKPRLAPRKKGPMVEWVAFKEPTYVLFTCGCFFYFWALYFGFFYINSYARTVIGFDSTTSINLLLVTNAAGIPARPLVGWLADTHIGPLNMFIMCLTCVGGMLYAWIGVGDRVGMYAFSIVYGLIIGASQGVFVGALASLTKDPSKMGTRFGMVCTLLGFATLAGPPTAGAIIDQSGGRYLWAQVWGGTVMLLAALMIIAARCWMVGKKLRVKA